jgi:hypothetical protein
MRPATIPTQHKIYLIAQNALSREHLRRKKTRLLCFTCGTLQMVTDIRPLAKVQVMECGHHRPAQ